jgi:hypothetical protein
MRDVTAQDLRNIVGELISPSIETHRRSAFHLFENSEAWPPPSGPPTDEEIDRFVAGNPLLDSETQEQLLDPGLLGFAWKRASASESWMRRFRKNVKDWAATNHWQGADEPWLDTLVAPQPSTSRIWLPAKAPQPQWLSKSPSGLLLARQLLDNGRMLSDMPWKAFEDLIGDLLERDGWTIAALKRTKDGGVDVWARLEDPRLGELQSIWQAKKYQSGRKVQLHHVRELAGVLDRTRATKAVIVTTSSLTRGAIEWIREDKFRLSYQDRKSISAWIAAEPRRLS